jgi:hypothetical protein
LLHQLTQYITPYADSLGMNEQVKNNKHWTLQHYCWLWSYFVTAAKILCCFFKWINKKYWGKLMLTGGLTMQLVKGKHYVTTHTEDSLWLFNVSCCLALIVSLCFFPQLCVNHVQNSTSRWIPTLHWGIVVSTNQLCMSNQTYHCCSTYL